MNRGDAYGELARELHAYRELAFEEIAPKVGQSTQRIARIGQEDVTIEVTVRWGDDLKRTIRIEAAAFGPNWWTTERLAESILVSANETQK